MLFRSPTLNPTEGPTRLPAHPTCGKRQPPNSSRHPSPPTRTSTLTNHPPQALQRRPNRHLPRSRHELMPRMPELREWTHNDRPLTQRSDRRSLRLARRLRIMGKARLASNLELLMAPQHHLEMSGPAPHRELHRVGRPQMSRSHDSSTRPRVKLDRLTLNCCAQPLTRHSVTVALPPRCGRMRRS